MVNHFECHQLLTEKFNLLQVMQRYCEANKENTFDLMPITFFVDISEPQSKYSVTNALQPFINVWQALELNKQNLQKLRDQLIQ